MSLKRPFKTLWWGPFPWEQDGGAIVNYYLLKMMHYLDPTHEFHCIPKVAEQLHASELSFANFYDVPIQGLGYLPPEIPQLILSKIIPALIMFHIPWEFFPIVDSVHDMGGMVINHQTVHWPDDVFFQSDRLQDIDYWIAPTRFAKRVLATQGKVATDKIFVIEHGVNTEKFYPHKTSFRKNMGIKDDEKVILWIGRCQLTKGAHVIIPIIRQLLDKYPKVHFVARAGVFTGIDRAMQIGRVFKHMANRHPRLHFLPEWTDPSYMEDLVASCDIMLNPSAHEGFSLTPLEGMACGKPVALSAIPVHVELVGGRNRNCGMLMETTVDAEIVNRYPSNPEGRMTKVPKPKLIYDTLQFMLENPDECEQMGQRGLRRAREVYDLAHIGIKWLDLFDHLFEEYNMDKRMMERLLIT